MASIAYSMLNVKARSSIYHFADITKETEGKKERKTYQADLRKLLCCG